MIPKVLHQVWLGSKPIPEQSIKFLEGFRTLHPDWDYVLWNENNLQNTEAWPLIEQCNYFSSKSNVARIYAILNYGGVYADMDIEWKKNINAFLNNEAFAATEKQEWKKFGNAFFGSVKDNPWLKDQWNKLPEYVSKAPPWGPLLMTGSALKYHKRLTRIDTDLIYPYFCDAMHKYKRKEVDLSKAYVVHHWYKSWMKQLKNEY